MKRILLMPLIAILLISAKVVSAQEPRVSCTNMTNTITMTVPSANAKCLTVLNNERAADGKPLSEARISSAAIVINDFVQAGKADPEVTVYSTSGLSGVNSEIYAVATSLTTLINEINQNGGAVTLNGALPFLPYQDKTQLFTALPSSINFENGMGVRAITAYGDSGASVSNDSLLYTVQAMSLDGTKYLSAVIPLRNSQITGPVDSTTFDWNALPADSWSPSLSKLDEYIRSIVIN